MTTIVYHEIWESLQELAHRVEGSGFAQQFLQQVHRLCKLLYIKINNK